MLEYLIEENNLTEKFEKYEIKKEDREIIIDFIQGKPRNGRPWYEKKFLYEASMNHFIFYT